MGKTKFTVRVDETALLAAKHYADEHDTTVTSLVEAFFKSLDWVGKIPHGTPVLNELAGSLKESTDLDDYRDHLKEKYLGES